MFSVLSVCTGNICRSPVAELLLARSLGPLGDVRIESAGTGALVGSGVPDQAQRLAASRGIDASAHRARQIDNDMIRGADLIVAMAREHRRLIVESIPAAMRRTFTLRELARIAEFVEPRLEQAVIDSGATTAADGMRAAVGLAAALRGTVEPPASPEEFDVVDPYRRSDETYERSFVELAPAADRVADYLGSAARIALSR
ncbi:MAG: protein-tyrosine-phosphatase [Microbacterium sp.]|jgi:protein-tyrosine phosphatase|uniref:arsenate reductase/protein-tyrosine-phosphatase family protein n=1 Tax=Microbacterium sp. Kw_RZR3 TaxID=3032903 RepID=UPI0023DB3BE9|nr:low molecular weight phosphatase family protein [Microbacterium sp. Kw_RZR3]MDF2045588.1 low molecular weight phosphatase family protein [Microbacterium sp. Kw_RZR3]MDF2916646.1 protein-tyrosine-phosphatase [Microbacterium sp.]